VDDPNAQCNARCQLCMHLDDGAIGSTELRCQATIANHVFDPSLDHFFTIIWPVSAEDALLSALERELEL
jgi:hypothetical protein